MHRLKTKFVLFLILAIALLFFSNNFGLLDIEKTAIITAVGIDLVEDKYEVTAQIAVPEATDTNSENKKTQISGKGYTVAEALKSIGDTTGWYPQLNFCNLLILGKSTEKENCITMLDYFAKTLRLQDSAVLVLADTSAKEILQTSSPLDNISSFALQKILLKAQGFNDDIATIDIKSFASGYYSNSNSSYMPIVKMKMIEEDASNGGSQSNSNQGEMIASSSATGGGENKKGKYCVFIASNTALYKKGFKVGTLDAFQTIFFNALRSKNLRYTTIPLKDIAPTILEELHNLLFTILRCNASMNITSTVNELNVNVDFKIYGKIVDQNSDYSDATFAKNIPLPTSVKEALAQKIKNCVMELFQISRDTRCDFLEIGDKIYRFNHKNYFRYKDNYLDVMKIKVNVEVSGQK